MRAASQRDLGTESPWKIFRESCSIETEHGKDTNRYSV